METEPELIAENIDVVKRTWQYRGTEMKHSRFPILRQFVGGSPNALSVGCGPFEPVITGVQTGCDVVPNGEPYLRRQGWNGKFVVCDARDLSFGPKEFDTAICSEVLEHLPTLEGVRKAISELDRVATRWLFTTPVNPIGPKNPEKTHKQDFTLDKLRDLCSPVQVFIAHDDTFFYVSNVAFSPETSATFIHDFP
jgi:hypothetical protein